MYRVLPGETALLEKQDFQWIFETTVLGRVLINGSHSDTLSGRSGHDPADKTGWIGRK